MSLDPSRVEARAGRLRRHARRLDGRSSVIATIRLVLGLLLLAAAAVAWRLPALRDAAWVVIAASAVAFVAAIAAHRRVHRAFRLASEVADAAARDVVRRTGGWRALARTGEGLASPGPAADLSADLSLLGSGSLFQLVSRCSTPWGERRLAELFTAATAAPDLRSRQDAARELARRGPFRRRLEAAGSLAADSLPGADALAAQLALPSWIDSRPWVAPLGIALATVTVAQIVLALAELPHLLLPSIAANVLITLAVAGRLREDSDALLDRAAPVLALADMLDLLARRAGRGDLAQRWSRAASEPVPAARAVRRLGRLLDALALRRNAFWFPVQAVLLWDFWQSARLARWRREHGARVAAWLAVLGEAEACSSLAGHAELFGGCFAVVDGESPPFSARALAHPLLPPEHAVPNDLALEGSGRVLLLTGSNMSGKSTLLRAVGLDAVLALAGGPSAASSLRLRPCRVMTSIRVTDALDEGVSLFYAEVRRLKAVVTAAESGARGDGPPVLFLVDEILRGTNARERHVASRALVERLAATGAAGIVTSHDVELAELEGQAPGVRNGHFREEIRQGLMTFDYTLRPGPVTTTNALEILRLEGLEIPGDPPAGDSRGGGAR